MSFAIKFLRSSMMTANEPKMCEGPLKETVLRWMVEADRAGAVAMTGDEAFVGLCLGYLVRGGK